MHSNDILPSPAFLLESIYSNSLTAIRLKDLYKIGRFYLTGILLENYSELFSYLVNDCQSK